jgi:pantothenate synthetase
VIDEIFTPRILDTDIDEIEDLTVEFVFKPLKHQISEHEPI